MQSSWNTYGGAKCDKMGGDMATVAAPVDDADRGSSSEHPATSPVSSRDLDEPPPDATAAVSNADADAAHPPAR